MATFANQTSNLSALASKFDLLLKVRDRNGESENYLHSTEEKRRNVEVFMASQRNRVENIEKELLTIIGNISPSPKGSKTITELAELCRLTQDATREKLEDLRSFLEDEGYTVTSPRTNMREKDKNLLKVSESSPSRRYNPAGTKCSSSIQSISSLLGKENNFFSADGQSSQTSLPLVTKFGGPLESVLEADYETDGMTTPGSYLESPAFSSAHLGPSAFASDEFYDSDALTSPNISARKENQRNRRKSSSFSFRSPGTPPSLDKLSISASTNNFLQNMESVGEDMEDDKSPSFSPHHGVNDISSSNGISPSKIMPKTPMAKDQYYSQQQEQQQQQHLYEFLDEDDMITLDTQSTMTKNYTFCSTGNETRSSVEERSQFFSQMEDILERVEETISEESPSPRNHDRNGDVSRHSDVHQEALQLVIRGGEEEQQHQRSIVSTSSQNNIVRPYRHPLEYLYEDDSVPSNNDEDSSMDFSEDSTNVVATQVAGKGTSKDETMSFISTENKTKNENPHNIFQQRPIHILVDTEVASPAHTNITMDATFMSDANETSCLQGEENYNERIRRLARGITYNDTEEDDENLSTVTPVLDRYRLDPSDDNSGVKVVPNKRSAHRNNQRQTPTPRSALPTIAQLSPSLEYIIHTTTPKNGPNEFDFMSPPERYLPSMPTDTSSIDKNRKVYRKTPFPKRKLVNSDEYDTSHIAEDENHDPNISPRSFISDYSEPFSISVPTLRSSSFGQKRADDSVLRLGSNRVLPLLESRKSSFSGESSEQKYLQEETETIQKIDETIERIDLELASPAGSSIHNSGMIDTGVKTIKQKSSALFVNEITEAEFESAPRIVRTNVSRDLANKALNAIHRYCSESMGQFHCLEFTEKEGGNIIGFSEQESKSILLSLCHWRRLLMKKDATRGIIFSVNNGKKEVRKALV